jgi:signal transduction histidine kinase
MLAAMGEKPRGVDAIDPHRLFEELRERVLRASLRSIGLGSVAVGGAMAFQGLHEGLLEARVLGFLALLFLSPLLLLLQRLPARVVCLSLLSHMLALCTYASMLAGLTPGATLLQVVGILLAALYFGRRGALLMLLAFLGSLVGVCLLWMNHVLPDPPAPYWDVHRWAVWMRYGVVLVVLCGILALTFVSMVQKLQATAQALAETLRRERAERATQQALQRALERSQRLHALGQLAAGLAHDIGNNLMILSTGTELIARDPTTSDSVLRVANRMSESLGTTVESLQQMRSLASGTQHLTRVGVAEPLEWLANALAHALPSNITLRVDVQRTRDLLVDRARLQQALLNLALNARDSMAEGGTLEVRAEPATLQHVPPAWHAEPGAFVVLSVRDTGEGMDAATQERIFEPLFTTKGERGTGLGLAMVHAFVHEARGFVEVESTPGQGSTFRLFLPVADDSAAQAHRSLHGGEAQC